MAAKMKTLTETIVANYKENTNGDTIIVNMVTLCLGWIKYGLSPSESEVRKALEVSDKDVILRVTARYRDVVKNQLPAEVKELLGGQRKSGTGKQTATVFGNI